MCRTLLGQGLNLKKLLDDPPADLLNLNRIWEKGVDAKYLEAEQGKEVFDNWSAMSTIWRIINDQSGVAYAVRLN